ncbi:MAG: pyridoxal phosphate-dependent aminotransferase [Haloarculaceae archaeon]
MDEDEDRPLFFHVMGYADAADGDVVDMVSGNPDWGPPEALREGFREYADETAEGYQYPPSEGLTELREEIAARRNVDAHRVVITNGAGEANYLVTACALEEYPGDEVVITDPIYPYYSDRAKLLGATPRTVPTLTDGILDVERAREVVNDDTALIILNSPNNPTGAVYGGGTKRELAALAAEHDAVFLSDEVYDHFDYSGTFETALGIDDGRVAVTNSISKTMAATGVRVGYAIVPESLVDPVRTRHMLTDLAVTRPGQQAVLKAYRETPQEYYERARETMADRVERFTVALDDAGAEYTTPQGAFYVMARFDGFPGTLENVKHLIDEIGVAGMPGEAFGESRVEWLRFALVTDRVGTAADRLAAFFEER